MKRVTGVACAAGLVGSVVVANYATTRFGFVTVGFGESATAGTLFAGLALALRDGVQDTLGRRAVLGVVAVGAALSYLIASPAIAIASALAFALAELADYAVYTPLRQRGRFGGRWWALAVVVSGAVGAVVDSVVFVWLAFGWPAVAGAIVGQLVGKTWASLGYLAVGKGVDCALLRQSDRRRGGA